MFCFIFSVFAEIFPLEPNSNLIKKVGKLEVYLNQFIPISGNIERDRHVHQSETTVNARHNMAYAGFGCRQVEQNTELAGPEAITVICLCFIPRTPMFDHFLDFHLSRFGALSIIGAWPL